MKFHNSCKACNNKISIISIMMALLPFYFTCPKCRSRMRAVGIAPHVFLSLFILGSVMLAAMLARANAIGQIDLSVLLIGMGFVLLIQLVHGLFVCNTATIVLSKDRHNNQRSKEGK